MGRQVTQSDVGKPIESHDGARLGVAASVDEEAVYVEPDVGTTDSTRATLGWEHESADTLPVQQAVIGEVTDDAIILDRELAVQGGLGTATGRPPSLDGDAAEGADRPAGDPDLEVDPSELMDDDPTAAVGPDEDVGSRSDAEAGRDTGAKRTDAAAEPPTEPRREDARAARSGPSDSSEQPSDGSGPESGDSDSMVDARRRPTELDEPDAAPGPRDDIGEIDEPTGSTGRTDRDEFGDTVDRSETENRPDVADPAASSTESEPRDASDVADRATELDDVEDRDADDGRPGDGPDRSASSDEESS